MFRYRITNEKKDTPLEEQITKLLEEMDATAFDSDEYSEHLTKLERLYRLRNEDKREPASMDTIIKVLGSVGGVMLITIWEARHVVTSRALSMVIRPRIE